MWASATNIALSTLLAVSGALVLRGGERLVPTRRLVAVALLVGAGLCYEAVLPAGVLVLVAGPWMVHRRPDGPVIALGLAGLAAVALWVAAHWHPTKAVQSEWGDLTQAFGAHLGWGIAPGIVASAITVAGLVGGT